MNSVVCPKKKLEKEAKVKMCSLGAWKTPMSFRANHVLETPPVMTSFPPISPPVKKPHTWISPFSCFSFFLQKTSDNSNVRFLYGKKQLGDRYLQPLFPPLKKESQLRPDADFSQITFFILLHLPDSTVCHCVCAKKEEGGGGGA